ncbi:glutathione peroxidase [Ameyamaea chiangmaiensis NBRC 103196]|uniref:Glutathione peroxidase n=1 Tax=Ameyamaea chiangmaiensis TaxID=442969 RepID=A0A850PG35_9PROT|nr:glutathione peroxidase [Ameyamaea chiangmaiensis]MBS4073874.1 glutathione peroxidase [Ameyamaea chiangmaiensis]NVN41400.1 glutathione peroxidase [Ameyamaea chiangmaiensis]GBQ68100.1 glutathione peroxidase [Ameyamaea chiangmaiensis NBRC 103196]
MSDFYDFALPGLDGVPIELSKLKGKAVLVVNTASKCGFTPQYEGLQALWARHRANGLVVVGVPSDDFGHQEPGDSVQIGQFCARNYGVSFPMAAKSDVTGPHTIPLFRWLAANGGFLSRPRWNFYKYIIGRDGSLRTWFTSITSPDSERFQTAIERVVLDH